MKERRPFPPRPDPMISSEPEVKDWVTWQDYLKMLVGILFIAGLFVMAYLVATGCTCQ